MFVSQSRLPHLLSPCAYWCDKSYDDECEVLRRSWHVVSCKSELANAGDFLTRNVLGTPIQIRNFDGQICALSNVCAHRHAMICSESAGNSPAMKCQYHGWEYKADGSTGRIPQPKNFVPFDAPRPCLPRYSVATAGQLVFVNLSPEAMPLRDFLGQDFFSMLEEHFGDEWTVSLKWRPDYSVNWKIPVENSLEAYHVPSVHPKTFVEDPGDDRSEHLLLEHRTAFGTSLPFSPHSRIHALFQRLEGGFMKSLGHASTNTYWQHHVFPNLLFSFTDAISLANCVLPTGPTTCQATVLQFGRLPRRGGSLKRYWAKVWAWLSAAITKRILIEDMVIFDSIQAGLRASQQPGLLGRCEERIHRFQQFMLSQMKSNY
ncbi:MAG: SRPBCC family protein [Pirellulaceae bacterium]|nr:SRPBCC family protein [Pirellulaceae bacterium]